MRFIILLALSFAFIVSVMAFIFVPSIFAFTENEKLSQLTPAAQKVFTAFLKKARELFPEHKIIVAETYRTQARQDMLYKKGRHVTSVKVSMHTKRLAADIYFVKDKKILPYEKAPYLELGVLGESFGLRWGGRWGQNGRSGPFDPGHYELRERKE